LAIFSTRGSDRIVTVPFGRKLSAKMGERCVFARLRETASRIPRAVEGCGEITQTGAAIDRRVASESGNPDLVDHVDRGDDDETGDDDVVDARRDPMPTPLRACLRGGVV